MVSSPSGPTSSSTPAGRCDQSCAPAAAAVGRHDPAGRELSGLLDEQIELRMRRQADRPQPLAGRGDHLQRAAADAAGRAEHRHVGNVVGHGYRIE